MTEEEFNLYQSSNKKLELKVNNQVVSYSILKLENEYRIVYTTKITDNTTVYKPEFTYNGLSISLNGYSAKTLANYYLTNLSSDSLVKQYKSCLEELIG